MDDTSGKEGLFLKAQHDEMHTVGHDQFVNVANNRTTEVGVDSLEKIGNDMSLEVGQNAQETVGVAKVVDVGSTLLSVPASRSRSVRSQHDPHEPGGVHHDQRLVVPSPAR